MRYLVLLLALAACSAPDYNADAVAHGAILCTTPATNHYPSFTFTTNTRDACHQVGGQSHG